jgi:hypothetical protein
MTTRTLFCLAGLLLAARAFAATPSPEERYTQAAAVLAHGCRGTGCDFGVETLEEQAALGALWQATQDWTIAWLGAHPDWSLPTWRNAIMNWRTNNLRPAAPSDIFLLRPGLYAVFAQYGEMGNVFLVEQRDGHFAIVWDIRNADPAKFPILKAWRTDQDNGVCRVREDAWIGLCGPLYAGQIHLLPNDGQSRLRFVIEATYAQAAETTVGGQLSVWSLDGTTPRLQWAKKYAYNFEDIAWKRNGDLLTIRAADWWRTFVTCGTCIGRQMDWRLRIRPDGVDDLGMKPVVPELDAVDELFFRAWKHLPLDDLASPKVQAVAVRITTEAAVGQEAMEKEYKLPPDNDFLYLGMLWGTPKAAVEREGRQVCFATDDTGPMRITFVWREGKLFATDVVEFPQNEGESCPKPLP